ncbi:MAG: copper homeostasis protein CutC [Chitinophagaceae bacterium]
MKKHVIEIACNNYTSCYNAYTNGADRIELFESIAEGGCTPSFGLMKKVKESFNVPIYAMIRPRGGHFVYSQEEVDIMKSDINTCRVLAMNGIVFGALTSQGHVDKRICEILINTWKGQPVTFHRAIDRCIDIEQGIEDLIAMGFERVLTSGGEKNVEYGKEKIKMLQEKYGSKIKIMPGSGVTPQNVVSILQYCQVQEIHATCKKTVSQVEYNFNTKFSDEFVISDENEISTFIDAVANYEAQS